VLRKCFCGRKDLAPGRQNIFWSTIDDSNLKVSISFDLSSDVEKEDFIEVELGHIKPLPALAYEKLDYGEAKVRQDGHVGFQNKYYSLEEKFILCRTTLSPIIWDVTHKMS
jgi:hypothetical protein